MENKTKNMENQIVVIYHNRDLDGWMSAAIVKLKYPEVNLMGWDYGMDIPNTTNYDTVIMCDVSFSADYMLDNLYQPKSGKPGKFIWIDHHKSAIDAWEEIRQWTGVLWPDGMCRTNYAACELTWMYFFPDEPMPEIVRLLGRYDSFMHKGTDEEQKVLEFQYGARANMFDVQTCYDALINWNAQLEHTIQIAGYEIHNYLCVEAEQKYKQKFSIDLDGYVFACVNAERLNPINFGIDYHKDGYDGFACFWYDHGQWCFSLYNDNGEVDCSAICKRRGGGGHKGAAGFRTTIITDII